MYREITPPPALRTLVECLWTALPSGATRVVPDGCMDLLLGADGRHRVAGPDTTAFVASTPPGTRTAGLRFRPGALPRLLGVPAAELRDTRAPLVEVSPAAARAAAGLRPFRLVEVLAEGAEHRETAPWPLEALMAVTHRLGAGAGAGEVARVLGRSERTFTRHCDAVYGYGPAALRRILRFRRAADLLHSGVAPAEVALRAGYADQPHLTREVRALAGVTPATLRG